MDFKRVIVETPYKAATKIGLKRNLEFARACAHDCLVNHSEAPFLSHLLYTQPGILDDNIPEERQDGIDAGLAWGEAAEATIVYLDRGVSTGMYYGAQNAQDNHRPVICRSLQGGIRLPHFRSMKDLHTTKDLAIDLNDPNCIENAVRDLLLKEVPHGGRVFYVRAMYDHIDDVYGPMVDLCGIQILISVGGPNRTVALLYEL